MTKNNIGENFVIANILQNVNILQKPLIFLTNLMKYSITYYI